VPLLAHGRPIGALRLAFRQERAFDEDERALMLALTQQCAVALERARLYVSEHEARTAAEAAVRIREEFLSIASHELKTPLTILLGSAQLFQQRAQRSGHLSERDAQAFARIMQQGQKLNHMIHRLLDVSRIDQGRLKLEFGTLDLSVLVRRAVAELQGETTRHRFAILGSDAPVVIAGDELRLEQVVQNLLGNAVKYSPRGGQITVTLTADAEQVRLLVQDQGIGVPSADLPRLVERFYRAGNVSGTHISGVGIGLYVVQEIINLHGGQLTLASQEGEGSTFSVTLPRGAGHTGETAERETAA
jgi:signal transduction histidine kinase